MKRINQQITKILSNGNKNGFFVKLTQKSAKNNMKLFAAKTLEDVYKNLINSFDVYR